MWIAGEFFVVPNVYDYRVLSSLSWVISTNECVPTKWWKSTRCCECERFVTFSTGYDQNQGMIRIHNCALISILVLVSLHTLIASPPPLNRTIATISEHRDDYVIPRRYVLTAGLLGFYKTERLCGNNFRATSDIPKNDVFWKRDKTRGLLSVLKMYSKHHVS